MYDGEKFKALVHYVCAKCDDPRQLGATKLNKILWYAECEAYLKLQRPISDAKFVKREFGPAPVAILPVLKELEKDGALVVREVEYFGNRKREFISLREPNLRQFSAEEISIIDRVTGIITEQHTAKSVSRHSHDDIYDMAEIGEELPLYTVLAVKGEVTEKEIAWADSKITELSAS
jgi:hypothetical protein